jgi:hypothetical protein
MVGLQNYLKKKIQKKNSQIMFEICVIDQKFQGKERTSYS